MSFKTYVMTARMLRNFKTRSKTSLNCRTCSIEIKENDLVVSTIRTGRRMLRHHACAARIGMI